MRILEGSGGAGGIAIGTVVVQAPAAANGVGKRSIVDAIPAAAERLESLAERARALDRDTEAEILDAHAVVARDPMLLERIQSHSARGVADRDAIEQAGEELAVELAALDDPPLAERAEDLRGVVRHIVQALTGAVDESLADLPAGAVICARDLTPADTVQMDLGRVAGFAVECGGPMSHTVIVARSLGIPAVVGVNGLLDALDGVGTVLIDGTRGVVVLNPDEHRIRDARRWIAEAAERGRAHRRLREEHLSFDGRRVLVAANVGSQEDLAHAVSVKADGIGLLRSEFLFLSRDRAPTAEEQAEFYRSAASSFQDPVVVRTLDIGGDKQVPYLNAEAEPNPFLGVRGVRFSLLHPQLFVDQLAALVRAGAAGDLRIMFPMISSLADFRAARAALVEAAQRVGAERPPAGVMIETPSAALLARHLAREADFFSIGTNDLVQYATAADRMAPQLARYHDAVEPPILALVQMTAHAANQAGKPVAACGEAAADPVAAALFVALGVDELSVVPAAVDEVRWTVGSLDAAAARRIAEEALGLPDADAVREAAQPLLR